MKKSKKAEVVALPASDDDDEDEDSDAADLMNDEFDNISDSEEGEGLGE